jgi:hypothetical protein
LLSQLPQLQHCVGGDNGAFGWELEVTNPTHNHMPTGQLGLPQMRKADFDNAALFLIEDGVHYNTPPGTVYAKLIKKGYHVSHKDVCNCMATCQLQELGGHSKIEALWDKLQKDFRDEDPDPIFPLGGSHQPVTYFAMKECDEEGCLKSLVWAHPYSIQRLKQHPDMVMLDCTYKTNRFNMPFLHVVGVTSMNRTFNIVFCFMPNELEESYKHPIHSLLALFDLTRVSPRIFITNNKTALKSNLTRFFPGIPQQACLWHLMNNLEVKILEIWSENKAPRGQEHAYKEKKDELLSWFATLVGADTEEGFDKLYKKLQDNYSGVPFILEYIKNGPMKHVEEWAEYTCQYLPSFGQCSTSRLESSHGRLKRSLVTGLDTPMTLSKTCTSSFDMKGMSTRPGLMLRRFVSPHLLIFYTFRSSILVLLWPV